MIHLLLTKLAKSTDEIEQTIEKEEPMLGEAWHETFSIKS
jgi:hypothetical protein